MCWPFGSHSKPKPPLVVNQPPASIPTVASPQLRKVLNGLYVFCGWASERLEFGKVPGTQCPHPDPWNHLSTNDRHMALGTDGKYDERNPAITLARVKMAEAAKFDHFIYQIELSHAHTNKNKLPSWALPFPGAPLLNTHCADNHAALDTPIKFCVSLWDVMASAGDKDNYWLDLKKAKWTGADVEASFRLFASTVATRYMTKATYLTVEGKPVLFKGNAETLAFYQTEFGLSPVQIIDAIREEVRTATGKELYLIATNAAAEHPDREDVNERTYLKRWGFDAFSPYLYHGKGGWDDAVATNKYWRERDLKAAKVAGLDYWPGITAGYDARAWKIPNMPVEIPTAKEFEAHVRETRAWALKNGLRGVNEYALDETGEGGIMETMAANQLHNGDEMMRAHAAACS